MKSCAFRISLNPLCAGQAFERRSLSESLPCAGGVRVSLHYVILSEAKNPRLYLFSKETKAAPL
jgi:hypothetical protein